MALLNIKDLCINYGMIQAVKGVDFTVEQGEIVALIGANGAGKTSISPNNREIRRYIR